MHNFLENPDIASYICMIMRKKVSTTMSIFAKSYAPVTTFIQTNKHISLVIFPVHNYSCNGNENHKSYAFSIIEHLRDKAIT